MNNLHTLLIDASAIAYLIEAQVQKYVGEDPDTVRKALIQWIDQRLFLNTAYPITPIWLLDSPPYWRSRFEPSYKAHRPPSAVKIAPVINALSELGVVKLGVSGYEADDLAGAIVRSLPSEVSHLLLTIDNDWGGLISKNVTMISPIYSPTVRTLPHAWAWLEKHHRELPKCRQCFYRLPSVTEFIPSEIWKFKSIVGDAGDNLPPGTHLGLIDLINPIVDPIEDVSANGQIWETLATALDVGINYDIALAQTYAVSLPELPFNPIRIGLETV